MYHEGDRIILIRENKERVAVILSVVDDQPERYHIHYEAYVRSHDDIGYLIDDEWIRESEIIRKM